MPLNSLAPPRIQNNKFMKTKWIKEISKYLFKSRWYNLRQDKVKLPNGNIIEYNVIESFGYSIIVPILNNNVVILEKIYRYPSDKIFIECPAGGIESDNPENDAKRELVEEIGYKTNSLTKIGEYHVSTGTSTEKAHIFLATDLVKSNELNCEETEEIEIIFLPLKTAIKMAYSGEIESMPTAFSLIMANEFLKKDKRNG